MTSIYSMSWLRNHVKQLNFMITIATVLHVRGRERGEQTTRKTIQAERKEWTTVVIEGKVL
jgi:hypothetical protein